MSRRLPPPRWQTALPASVAGSWGPEVARYAELELGLALDRWQRRALNRALATDAAGRLVHRHYLTSSGRQQGKTVKVRSLVGWALTSRDGPEWVEILGIAHDRKQARIPYRAVMVDLAGIRRRSPRGALAITSYLGIRSDLYGRHREYDVGSKESRDAIRGSSTDLGLFDEVRTQRGYDTWAALEPTTRARPEPLIYATSTAGDDRSVLLRDWFERGLRIIDGVEPAAGFGMTWYAADDDDAPDDPRAWAKANPALAEGRISPDGIRASLYALSPATFRAETLNLWSDGSDELVPAGTWAARVGRQPAQAHRVILGVEVVPTWRRVSVTVALATDAGVWIGVAGELDTSRTGRPTISPAELVDLVDQLARDWRPAAVAYSKAAAAAPHIEAWATATTVPALGLGPRQIRAASQLFRSELIGGRLTHEDDALLAAQFRSARASGPVESGDWYYSIRESVGEIDALRAAVWASWAAIAPEELTAPLQIF